ILDHGKRADSIVKNMLQHSRKQVGELELTDINALADEYLKLSYQGYRARHKDFNCILHTSFEADLGLVKIIPQDIGRIIINLFSNSFYSVGEKKKKHPEYNPEVSLSTQKRGKFLILTVRDNGLGISQENIQKIYHPFFTTKPTGEGTGLGLSMSYDIMKAHQGELKVDSVEGEYASFTLEIPI
ncbi:MAG: ATP-binding protein, partial [Ferruginibacter sp.]